MFFWKETWGFCVASRLEGGKWEPGEGLVGHCRTQTCKNKNKSKYPNEHVRAVVNKIYCNTVFIEQINICGELSVWDWSQAPCPFHELCSYLAPGNEIALCTHSYFGRLKRDSCCLVRGVMFQIETYVPQQVAIQQKENLWTQRRQKGSVGISRKRLKGYDPWSPLLLTLPMLL